MDGGLVRGILWRHLAAAEPRFLAAGGVPSANGLLPAAPFADTLAAVARAHGEAELRRLAADFVALWARTFQTLVRHLRGRPERALALWAEEVYPFLRGHRLAARVERRPGGRTYVVLADDLPAAFLAGLVESFVGLTGARVRCEPRGPGLFEVRHEVAAPDRLAAWVQQATLLRIPLLACAAVAAAVGILAGFAAGDAPSPLAGAAFAGTLAAQGGANAVQDLRGGREFGPLGPVRPAHAWSWVQAVGCYGVAAACAGFLAASGRPWVVPLAAAGLAAGLLYEAVRSRGLGPLVAGATYGPLIVAGSAYAVAGPALAGGEGLAGLLPAALAIGGVSAAVLFAADLADRPLDEAGGRRTLVVRLPARRHAFAYALLAAAAPAGLFLHGAVQAEPWTAAAGLAATVPVAALARQVQARLDDPHRLAAVRAGTLALLAATAAILGASLGALA